jgi:SulP family sulfate permease
MHPTPSPSLARTALVGVDAALVSCALGFMYALVTSAPVGAAALPVTMLATLVGFVVGGMVMAGLWRGPRLMATPNATGVLILSAMLFELQGLPGLHGSIAAALVAIAGTGLLYGVLQLLFARWGVGAAMKFLPFPVVSGFTNTIALSLIVSMLPSALGHATLGRLLQVGTWWSGVHPGAIIAAAAGTLAGLATRQRWPLAPASIVALVVGTATHHALSAWSAGPGVGPALAVGHQLWPDLPQASAWLDAAGGWHLWVLVLKTALVMAVLNSLFSLLTATALMRADDPPLDGNRLLQALGWGNIASSLCMGLPIAVVSPTSIVVRRQPVRWRPLLVVYVLALLAVFLAGHDALRQLPLAAVAAAVFTAASGMFDAWSLRTLREWVAGRSFEPRAAANLAVSAGVTLIGLLLGLAAALFVGTLAAVVLLAVEMRRTVVIDAGNGLQRRSRRMRQAAEAALLDQHGAQIRVVALGHWLYFGTVDELGSALHRHSQGARWLILDLHQVAGVDATAARALWMASQRLASQGVQLVMGGLPEGDARQAALAMFDQPGATLHLVADVDHALEQAEDALLAQHPLAPPAHVPLLALPGLSEAQLDSLAARLQRLPVQAGQKLFAQGDEGQALYVVVQGRVTLRVGRGRQGTLRLLTFGPGLMFGEMALLDGHLRSTDAIADEDGEVARLTRADLDDLATTDAALHTAVLRGLALHLVARLRETTRLLQERG